VGDDPAKAPLPTPVNRDRLLKGCAIEVRPVKRQKDELSVG
jgi:hypothetical protein